MSDQVPEYTIPAVEADTDLYDLPLPYSKGDWLETLDDVSLRVAMVRKCYWYRNHEGELALYGDLWMYDFEGTRIGRVSPVQGGPRSYEPFCELSGYRRIKEPQFPIELCQVPTGELTYTFAYRTRAKLLGPRKPRKRVKLHPARAVVTVKESDNGFDPQAEARALRIAAENLRDMARNMSAEVKPELIERAKKLEAEADNLVAPL